MITQPLDLPPLPPEQAIAWFKAKGYQFSWDWADMWQSAHSRAFTVAKVTKADILADIRNALVAAMEDGTTFEQFKQDLTPLLQRRGWWGRQEAVDTATGETRTVQLGSAYRLRTIFNTNIQTSLQVGHYQAMTDPDVLAARPYWRYSAVMDGATRPQHAAWNGIVRPADSPWWDTHYPPNGWNCRCTVVSMSKREIERDGLTVARDTGRITTYEWTNPATGKVERVPTGIDPGWAYNPGIDPVGHALAVARDSAAKMPDPIRWRLLADLEE